MLRCSKISKRALTHARLLLRSPIPVLPYRSQPWWHSDSQNHFIIRNYADQKPKKNKTGFEQFYNIKKKKEATKEEKKEETTSQETKQEKQATKPEEE